MEWRRKVMEKTEEWKKKWKDIKQSVEESENVWIDEQCVHKIFHALNERDNFNKFTYFNKYE